MSVIFFFFVFLEETYRTFEADFGILMLFTYFLILKTINTTIFFVSRIFGFFFTVQVELVFVCVRAARTSVGRGDNFATTATLRLHDRLTFWALGMPALPK